MNLNFDNNWRRTLLLTNQSDRDVDQPISYVILDKTELPCSFKKFCEKYAYDYKFDYDIHNKVVWPLNDNTPTNILVTSLNNDFPKIASIITKKPSIIHNLSFNDFEDTV
jgi:hypothetical protein